MSRTVGSIGLLHTISDVALNPKPSNLIDVNTGLPSAPIKAAQIRGTTAPQYRNFERCYTLGRMRKTFGFAWSVAAYLCDFQPAPAEN